MPWIEKKSSYSIPIIIFFILGGGGGYGGYGGYGGGNRGGGHGKNCIIIIE